MRLLQTIAILGITRLGRCVDVQSPFLRKKLAFALPEDTSENAITELEQSVEQQAQGLGDRLAPLVKLYCSETLARVALELAVARLLFPDVEEVITALTGTGEATVELASQVVNAEYGVGLADAIEMRLSYELLTEFILPVDKAEFFFRRALHIDERLLMFYSGSDRLGTQIAERTALYYSFSVVQQLYYGEYASMERALSKPKCVLQVSGESGSGKLLRLRHACAALGRALIVCDMRPELPDADELHQIRREALFYNAVLCFRHLDSTTIPDDETVRRFIVFCVEPALALDIPVAVFTDGSISLMPYIERFTACVYIPPTDRNVRFALWQGYAKQFDIDMDSSLTTAKLKLSPLQIAQAAQRMSELGKHHPTLAEVTAICSEVLPPPKQGNILRIHARYTLDDIKLPPEQKSQLQNICAHVWYRRRVYDEWNMESRYAYGKNVSALFVGQPGTGKTMAVHVLATMLDLPLYQIDLSQVVDKYIGETEKRLEEVFNTAERTNTILFFDEADSIFGKRSQVNEAKDRYANTSVSYILQRVEQYDGVIVLASNFKTNIDNAFMRRIRYVIEFSLPDAQLRMEIWKSCFPPEMPLLDVNFEYLARQFELPGGDIKNIALNAAFLAASEQECVSMRHILLSLRSEYHKTNKTILKHDIGEYAYLWDEPLYS